MLIAAILLAAVLAVWAFAWYCGRQDTPPTTPSKPRPDDHRPGGHPKPPTE